MNVLKNLFVCNSVYQCMVANCIKRFVLTDEEADIILTDHSYVMKDVYKNIKKHTSLFKNVYYLKNNYLQKVSHDDGNKEKEYIEQVLSKVKDMKWEGYNRIFLANLDYFMDVVVKEWADKQDITFAVFEDGLSIYSFYGPVYAKRKVLKEFYFFDVSKVDWDTSGKKVISVPKNILKDKEFQQELNLIFGYNNLKDSYKEKYIYFEDGYSEGIDDLYFLEILSEIVGKENILVKKHPRSTSEKFVNAGYQTNISLEVPWEIIVMNMSNSDNVLITTYSQCVIMSDLLFDVKMKNIILLNLISEKDGRKYADYLKKYFFNKNNTNYNVPENKEEYILMVKEYEKDK